MDCEFKTLPMSEDQFLAWAEGRDGGYELVEGAVMMRAGATRDHERVAKRIFALLWPRRRSILYPDMVVDPQSGSGEERATLTPIVVIEVLSASSDLTITSKNSRVTPSGRRCATTPSSTRNSHGLFSGHGRRQAGRTSPGISTGQGRSSRLSTPACR